MAFTIFKLNDPCGIIFLVLLAIPLTTTTNIDCNGKPFHCVNSTHFMICVDLGSGVSGTLDNFIIPCPPPTVCQGTNRFECEFPTVPTQAPRPLETIALQTTTIYQGTDVYQNIDSKSQATTIPSETLTISFEDYYNTLSATTSSHNEVRPVISILTTDSSVTDVFSIFNNDTFGNHENLETVGSGATQEFTTGLQNTQTQFIDSSTNAPETATIKISATATVFTTAETEASTNLDTVTTPVNEIPAKTFEVTTNVPYSASIAVLSPQTTEAGAQTNVSLSTKPSDALQVMNTTQETASMAVNTTRQIELTASSYENQINNFTEIYQAVADVVNTISSPQITEIPQTIAINNTYFTSVATVTDQSTDLTTEVLLPSTTSFHNINLPTVQSVAIEVTRELSTTAEFENIATENNVHMQLNETEPSTEPMPEISTATVKEQSRVKTSTLLPNTDPTSIMIETVTLTDGTISNSPLSTTESYVSTVPNILPVPTINLNYTLVTDKLRLSSVPSTESAFTASGITTLIGEVPTTRNNTTNDTSVSIKSVMDLIEFSTATYDVTSPNSDKIAFESSSKYVPNNVTQTIAPMVTDRTYIDISLNNTIDNNNQVHNETLSVVDTSTPIETITYNESSHPVLINASTQSLHIITEATQQPSLDEVTSSPNIPVKTSQPLNVYTTVSVDGNKKGLLSTESFVDGSVTITEYKPIINTAAKDETLTTMSLQNFADKPLELTTATNIVNSKTITDAESTTTNQPSASVITLNPPDINNNSTSSNSISHNTSKITISDKSSSNKIEGSALQEMEFSTTAVKESVQNTNTKTDAYTTLVTTVRTPQSPKIKVVTEYLTIEPYHTISSVDSSSVHNSYDVPIITIATPSKDKTSTTESSSTVNAYTANLADSRELKMPIALITEIPTTVLPVLYDQTQINVNDKVDPINIDNQIKSAVTDKNIDSKSYNTNQANNVIQSTIDVANGVVIQDNVPTMNNSETLSHYAEPVPSQTEASPMISVSQISNVSLSVNVLDIKYQNAIVKNNLDSTTHSTGIETTSFQSLEPLSIGVMMSTTFIGQKINETNTGTLTSDQSNKIFNKFLNFDTTSKNKVSVENTTTSAINIDVSSNINNVTPSIIAQLSALSLPSQQDHITYTTYNITNGTKDLDKNQMHKQLGTEQSNNLVLSPVINNQDVNGKLNNQRQNFNNTTINVQPKYSSSTLSVKVESSNNSTLNYNGPSSIKSIGTAKINEPTTITNKNTEKQADIGRLHTYTNFSMANVRSNETTSKSSNSIKSSDITTLKSNINDSKILRESAIKESALRSDQSDITEITNISTETPRSKVSQFTQTTDDLNISTKRTHSGIVSLPPKHQDINLKTSTKDLIYKDDNSFNKLKEKVSDIEQNKQQTSGQSNYEKKFTNTKHKTTNIKLNSDKETVLRTVSPKMLNISDEEETQFTKGFVNELSKSSYTPNVNEGNVDLSIFSVNTRVDPGKAAESDIESIRQLPKREELSTPTSSSSYTTQPYFTPKAIINSTSRKVAITTNTVVKPFLCNPYLRGRFADNHDCRKFYICIGWPLPMTGICPINTVFSEIRKQCTNNLSHCVRNNQFQCVSEGRFSDFLNDNMYYICVRNKLNHFVRFKLRCQNGYHLNKTSVRCVLNTEGNQSISISDKSISDQSGPLAKLEKKPVSDDFECKNEGKFADPSDCRIYYICKIINDSEFKRKKKKCDSDEYFHSDKKRCVDAESYECNT